MKPKKADYENQRHAVELTVANTATHLQQDGVCFQLLFYAVNGVIKATKWTQTSILLKKKKSMKK